MSEEIVVQDTGSVQPEPTQEPIVSPIVEFDIDGRKVSIDEIRGWEKGFMRQSDYTRKTQELSNQRKEVADAVELYEYLKANPSVAKRLKEAEENGEKLDPNLTKQVEQLSPEMQRIAMLERKIAMDELDKEIDRLTNKYPDFDVVKVLEETQRIGVDDLEFVYKSLRDVAPVDIEQIKAEAIKQAKEELAKQMSENNKATQTIIDGKAEPVPVKQELSASEKRVAKGMGLTDEEYLTWKNK